MAVRCSVTHRGDSNIAECDVFPPIAMSKKHPFYPYLDQLAGRDFWWENSPRCFSSPKDPCGWTQLAKIFAMAAWRFGYDQGRRFQNHDHDLHSLGLHGFFPIRPIFAASCPVPCRVRPVYYEAAVSIPEGEKTYALLYPDIADDWADRPPVGGYIDDDVPFGEAIPLTTSMQWCHFFMEEIHRAYSAGQDEGIGAVGEAPAWPGWTRSFMWVINPRDSIPAFRDADLRSGLTSSPLRTSRVFDRPRPGDVTSESPLPPGETMVPALWEIYPGSLLLDAFWPDRQRYRQAPSMIVSSTSMLYG
jgi:hypothetical protein